MGSLSGHERKWRLPRVWSNDELRRLAPLLGGEVVNVSAWRDEDKQGGHYRDYFSAATSYSLTNWHGERGGGDPDSGELLLNLEEPLSAQMEGRFDVVFNHTTLEHVFNVFTAFESLARLTRDVVVVVVPCQQELHYNDSFGDYWRFSHLGLRRLCERNGLTPIYEAASPDEPNMAIYLLIVAAKHPERWRGQIPEQRLGNVYLGSQMVRNDPWTLWSTGVYCWLMRRAWYRRRAKRYIRRRFRGAEGE